MVVAASVPQVVAASLPEVVAGAVPEVVAGRPPRLDPIDLVSVPYFAVTMLAERAALRRAFELRAPDDLDRADERTLSGDHLPADRLVPVGYERRDTIASLSMLVGSVAITFATAGLLERLHRIVFRRRIADIGSRRGALLGAMVLWDFLYYWDHRWMHRVRLLWANHVSHHSSRRYNLSTALRQPWSSLITAWVFLPMPLLGFTAAQTRRAGQLNLLYQYWIHTEAIDHLPGVAERVLNTPSHHRVHHGVNRQYIDRNFGGILILWDRWFGTFEPERRRVKYGLTKNVTTHNPLRLAYHEFAAIARDVHRARHWKAALRAIAGPPH
jgi:sterol desaturase/sphingolipid hydroxylase (fatty acid hydroxylase superfamily)